MSDTALLSLEPRTEAGSTAAKQLRAAGRVPCVVYSSGEETKCYSVDAREFGPYIHQDGTIDIKVDGKKRTAAIKEVQLNRISGDVLSIDFQAMSAKEAAAYDAAAEEAARLEAEAQAARDAAIAEAAKNVAAAEEAAAEEEADAEVAPAE